ncbi:hypothetical protein FACS189444_1430 [Spirochaetia bacterium]|nr:hypothetical protein FACS189444_1430 [Spirochaetia bacterium]
MQTREGYKTYITIRHKVFGQHRWPEPFNDELQFLASPHSHQFGIRVKMAVTHLDRQKEFFDEKGKLIDHLKTSFLEIGPAGCLDFGTMSCEQLAELLITAFPYYSEVEVDEDGDNSATVSWQ